MYLWGVSLNFGTLFHHLFCNFSTKETFKKKQNKICYVKCILNVSTIQITVIFVLFSYKSLHRPVSKATTLEEEITTGHSADLTRLLQPASTTEEERAINIYVMLCPLFFVFQVL